MVNEWQGVDGHDPFTRGAIFWFKIQINIWGTLTDIFSSSPAPPPRKSFLPISSTRRSLHLTGSSFHGQFILWISGTTLFSSSAKALGAFLLLLLLLRNSWDQAYVNPKKHGNGDSFLLWVQEASYVFPQRKDQERSFGSHRCHSCWAVSHSFYIWQVFSLVSTSLLSFDWGFADWLRKQLMGIHGRRMQSRWASSQDQLLRSMISGE